LDAGCNQLAEAVCLRQLPKLTQLSLEENQLDSLDTFSSLQSLVELYLCGNLLEELRSVLLLRSLPLLAALDLSGNELCSAQDYRLYVIFHLKQLRVLDGITISPAEQASAEERFAGKLTLELLEEKLGPSPSYYGIRSVDLSGQSLKELGPFLNEDLFPSMRELILDGNPFNNFKSVGPLPKLLVLRLNNTKIDVERGLLNEAEGAVGIASLPQLQVLEICNSGVADLSHFTRLLLPNLKILHLAGNEIGKVEGLSRFEQLRELVLDRNKIKHFEEGCFAGLKTLRELRIEDNGIKSLSHLQPLTRLRALHLNLNRVADLAEIEKLRHLRQLLIFSIAQNPVARKPMYRLHVIQALPAVRAIDGREVTAEEREKAELLLVGCDAPRTLGQGTYFLNDQQLPHQSGLQSNFLIQRSSPDSATSESTAKRTIK